MLEVVSDVLPLSYAVDAMQAVSTTTPTADVWQDLVVVGGVRASRAWPSAPLTLRRQTA